MGYRVKFKVTEKDEEKAILQYLEFLPECFAFKINTVGIYDKEKQVYRTNRNKYVVNGTSDILGIYKTIGMAIEVKKPSELKYIFKHWDMLKAYSGECKKKSRYRDQIRFIENYRLQGGIGFFADSVEMVKRELEQFFLGPDSSKVDKSRPLSDQGNRP